MLFFYFQRYSKNIHPTRSVYNEDVLERAVVAVVEGRMTLHGASEKFKIPYGTILNK